ncbi:purine/pyrimidine permease [Brevibacillus sp. SIMBA_040]|uniref:purine/pyrimidine permease n=1 Tax=unclassified Brevibacillus TaxID=2684853 RepID=UPI00397D9A40
MRKNAQISGWNETLGAMQWFVYLLVYSIPIPIVIGGLYHLPVDEIASLMQRTFLVAGASTVLQGLVGHRLPIADGPAGIWLSVFVILGDMALRQGDDLSSTLRVLTGGMLFAGLVLFAVSGIAHRFASWFTPLVTGSFLLLLSFQLDGVFIKGMLGAGGGPLTGDRALAGLVAVGVFVLVFCLSTWGRSWWRSYAILIGILAGWLAFSWMGMGGAAISDASWFRLPQMFAWGPPQFDLGMAIAVLPLVLMLLSSTLAATESMEQAIGDSQKEDPKRFSRGALAGGFTHLLSSVFSTVGIVPLGGSAGFVSVTGQSRLRPFLIGGLIMVCLSFIPVAIGLLTTLPAPVAYAVELAAFVPMVGLGVRAILREVLTERRLTILGVTLLIGLSIMFLPSDMFQGLPTVVQYIAGNGLLVGVLIAMILEKLWKEQKHFVA